MGKNRIDVRASKRKADFLKKYWDYEQSGISDDLKTILNLYYIQGETLKSIAERMGLTSFSTVQDKLRQATSKIDKERNQKLPSDQLNEVEQEKVDRKRIFLGLFPDFREAEDVPEDTKDILYYYYVEGKTLDEVAEIKKISRATVHGKRNSAITKILFSRYRDKLGDIEGDETAFLLKMLAVPEGKSQRLVRLTASIRTYLLKQKARIQHKMKVVLPEVANSINLDAELEKSANLLALLIRSSPVLSLSDLESVIAELSEEI